MPRQHEPAFTPEAASTSASGGAGERQSLPALQAKMKRDPEGYEAELRQLRRHFKSSVFLFRQQAALASTSSSPGGGEVAKELGDLALFLAHVAPFYPDDLADLPDQIGGLLDTNARALPSGLRVHLVQALILLVNRKLFGFAYGGPFGHFLHKVLDYIFKGKKDTKTVAKKFWPIVGWINHQYMSLQFWVIFHSFLACCWGIFLNLRAGEKFSAAPTWS